MKHNKNHVGCRKAGPQAIPIEVTCEACLDESPKVTVRELAERATGCLGLLFGF